MPAQIGLEPGASHDCLCRRVSDRRKGFDILFEAWKLLCADKAWQMDLAVVGAGAEVPAWEARCREAGIGSRVRFLGLRNDMAQVLRACDAMVAPTRYEAYGLAVHEALCCGLPAFVSESAGVAERYPDLLSDLLLPDRLSAMDLARRLRTWHLKPLKYRAAVQQLSETLRSYSWEQMAKEIATLMERPKQIHSESTELWNGSRNAAFEKGPVDHSMAALRRVTA